VSPQRNCTGGRPDSGSSDSAGRTRKSPLTVADQTSSPATSTLRMREPSLPTGDSSHWSAWRFQSVRPQASQPVAGRRSGESQSRGMSATTVKAPFQRHQRRGVAKSSAPEGSAPAANSSSPLGQGIHGPTRCGSTAWKP